MLRGGERGGKKAAVQLGARLPVHQTPGQSGQSLGEGKTEVIAGSEPDRHQVAAALALWSLVFFSLSDLPIYTQFPLPGYISDLGGVLSFLPHGLVALIHLVGSRLLLPVSRCRVRVTLVAPSQLQHY